MAGAAHNRHRSKQNYATPWPFIHAIEKRFERVVFDLAADASNAKATQYFCVRDDALSQCWALIPGLAFLNPPFGTIAPWAAKCREESALGARIAFLVPASVGANWYWDSVKPYALTLCLTPRLSFDGKHPYPKDLALAMYGYGNCGAVERWRWR